MTLEVKVCGITRSNDIEKIQKLDVDHIGFINIIIINAAPPFCPTK